MDLDTGAVVAAELHPADEGDTTTLSKTLAKAEAEAMRHHPMRRRQRLSLTRTGKYNDRFSRTVMKTSIKGRPRAACASCAGKAKVAI